METKAPKSALLGWAFLIQFVTSFTSGVFILPAATGVSGFGVPPDIDRIMVHLTQNADMVRWNILGELGTAAGVVFLGASLFSVLKQCYEGLALTAFGLYVLEGAWIGLSRLMLYLLLVVSQGPGGAPETAGMIYSAMGYAGLMTMVPFCLGATIFYALLIRARTVPLPLALWGLISVQGCTLGTMLGIFGVPAPAFLYFAYIPFELMIGLWIVIRRVPRPQVGPGVAPMQVLPEKTRVREKLLPPGR